MPATANPRIQPANAFQRREIPQLAQQLGWTGVPIPRTWGAAEDMIGRLKRAISAQAGVTTPPTYGSVGLESGRNILIGCPSNVIDLSLARTIRLGGARELRFQVDAFNAFNKVNYTARNTTINYTSPTNLTILNSQYNADGTIASNRLLPRNAGFGAATNAEALRNFQAMIRFSF